MPGINSGIGRRVDQAAGGSWSSYWLTRTPSELTLTIDSDNQITPNWTINGSGYDGFSIERSDDLGVSYNEITTVDDLIATYANSGLTRGFCYYYRIRAFKGSQYSPYSNIASAWTLITTLIGDTNTVGQYIASDLTTITKDGANLVSRINDKLGSGNDLLQADSWRQPLWSADGITFNGIDEFMRGTFLWNQPLSIYILLKQISWTYDDYLFDGSDAARVAVVQQDLVPGLRAYAGIPSHQDNSLVVGEWGVIRFVANGVDGKFQINNNLPVIGNFGAFNPDGFCIGANGLGNGNWSNIIFKEAICRKTADTVANQDAIYNYLINKYEL